MSINKRKLKKKTNSPFRYFQETEIYVTITLMGPDDSVSVFVDEIRDFCHLVRFSVSTPSTNKWHRLK